MKLHRFYITEGLKEGNSISIYDTDKLNQWLNVFRMKAGENVVLFNGDGWDYLAKFTEIHKKGATLEISTKSPAIQIEKKIHLYMALIKKDLFELVVEKCTELGVTEITPITTERTVDKNLNMERLERIAIEASEQCGRADVPGINPASSLELIASSFDDNTFVADMGGLPVSNYKRITKSYKLIVGPEGGWSEAERGLIKKAKVISLGRTTLRAETAAIVAISALV